MGASTITLITGSVPLGLSSTRPVPSRAASTARTYKWQLVAERIFDVDFAPDISRFVAVQDGIANEDPAREALSKYLRLPVVKAEFKFSQDRRWGGSPDGYVGNQPVEIKAPQIPRALQNMAEDPRDYWPQLQGQLLLHPDATQLHFWSWSPFIEPGAYYVVSRDMTFCDGLHRELRRFCQDLDDAEMIVRGMAKFDVEAARDFLRQRRGEENGETESAD